MNPACSNESNVHIALTILIGGITGLIVCFMTRSREPRTPIASAAIGVVGAIIADYAIHRTDCCAQMSPADLIGILIGALILLSIDRYARSKPH